MPSQLAFPCFLLEGATVFGDRVDKNYVLSMAAEQKGRAGSMRPFLAAAPTWKPTCALSGPTTVGWLGKLENDNWKFFLLVIKS